MIHRPIHHLSVPSFPFPPFALPREQYNRWHCSWKQKEKGQEKEKQERATALRSRNIFQRGTAQSVNTICNSLEDKREAVVFFLPVSDEIDYMEKMYTHLSIYLCSPIYLYSHLHK